MGCHTWFYKKIESPSYETMKNFVIDKYKTTINDLNKWINNPNDEEYLSMLGGYPEWDINYITNWRDIDMRRVRAIEGGYCEKSVCNKYCLYSDEIMIMVGDNTYVEVDGYHDLFRKYGYPETQLFSYVETIDYINNPKNECTVYDWTIERLKQFWDEYPNGMIDFG